MCVCVCVCVCARARALLTALCSIDEYEGRRTGSAHKHWNPCVSSHTLYSLEDLFSRQCSISDSAFLSSCLLSRRRLFKRLKWRASSNKLHEWAHFHKVCKPDRRRKANRIRMEYEVVNKLCHLFVYTFFFSVIITNLQNGNGVSVTNEHDITGYF